MVIHFTLEVLWSVGEPEEDEGETEEPKVCAPKQFEFYWACTWLEEGGAPILGEDKAQGLLFQVFWFSQTSSSLILFWCFVFSILAFVYILKSTGLSNFRICIYCNELIS